ncbi:hypothetical protein XENOCAPTIV_016289 [Xenoophorus captivus]|uniref:Uncharacterized protein n=1 Tax=Xenoophorus captivus TaxID=1517983 RepID=A0ABV0S983_9TELE
MVLHYQLKKVQDEQSKQTNTFLLYKLRVRVTAPTVGVGVSMHTLTPKSNLEKPVCRNNLEFNLFIGPKCTLNTCRKQVLFHVGQRLTVMLENPAEQGKHKHR